VYLQVPVAALIVCPFQQSILYDLTFQLHLHVAVEFSGAVQFIGVIENESQVN
jgi:hypothetical protein